MGITVKYQYDLYTLLVDKIGDVIAVEQKLIENSPATLRKSLGKLFRGIIRRKENLLVVLDVEKILDQETIFNTPITTRCRRRADTPKQIKKSEAPKADASDEDQTQEAEAAPAPTENPSASSSGECSIFDRIGGEIGVHGATSMHSSRMLEDPKLSGAVSAGIMDAINSDTQRQIAAKHLRPGSSS